MKKLFVCMCCVCEPLLIDHVAWIIVVPSPRFFHKWRVDLSFAHWIQFLTGHGRRPWTHHTHTHMRIYMYIYSHATIQYILAAIWAGKRGKKIEYIHSMVVIVIVVVVAAVIYWYVEKKNNNVLKMGNREANGDATCVVYILWQK